MIFKRIILRLDFKLHLLWHICYTASVPQGKMTNHRNISVIEGKQSSHDFHMLVKVKHEDQAKIQLLRIWDKYNRIKNIHWKVITQLYFCKCRACFLYLYNDMNDMYFSRHLNRCIIDKGQREFKKNLWELKLFTYGKSTNAYNSYSHYNWNYILDYSFKNYFESKNFYYSIIHNI